MVFPMFCPVFVAGRIIRDCDTTVAQFLDEKKNPNPKVRL